MSLKIPANFGLSTSLKELSDAKIEIIRKEKELNLYIKEFIDSVILTKEQVLASIPSSQYHLYCKKKVELTYKSQKVEENIFGMTYFRNSNKPYIKNYDFSGSIDELLSPIPFFRLSKDKIEIVKYFIIDSDNHLLIPVYIKPHNSNNYYFNDDYSKLIINDVRRNYQTIDEYRQNDSKCIYHEMTFYHEFDLIKNKYICTTLGQYIHVPIIK